MKNFVQEGDILDVTAPYDVTSGGGVLVGAVFGIACNTAKKDASLQIKTTGVFDVTTLSTDTATAYTTPMYWDDTNKRLTTTATDNTKVGVAVAAKLAAATYTTVRLNGVFG